MDADLRDLERLMAAHPDDPSVRERWLRAHSRAGLPVLPVLATEMARHNDALDEARRRHAIALRDGLRGFVSGAFREHPGLDLLHLDWSLEQETDRPWTVRCRAVTDPRAFPFLPGDRPVWSTNVIDMDAHRSLRRGLLAFAGVLASRSNVGACTFVRLPEGGVRCEEEASLSVHAIPEPELAEVARHRDDPELHALALDELGLREVTLRELEETLEALWKEGGERLVDCELHAEGDTRAALAVAAEAETALATARAAYLAAARPCWAAFPHALFAENADVDLVAVHGFTPGYNDNWYVAHEQRILAAHESIGHVVEEQQRAGLDDLGLATPGRPVSHSRESALRTVFEPYFQLLHDLHGFAWLVVLRRTAEGVSVRVGPATRPS